MGATVRVFGLKGYVTTPPPIAPTVRVFSVSALTSASFTPPVSDAGADQINVEPWTTVTLSGSASTASGGATVVGYSWSQTGGTTVVEAFGLDTISPSFKVPGSLAGGNITYGLIVTDSNGSTSNTDTVVITALPVTEAVVKGGTLIPYEPLRVKTLG